MGVSPLSRYSPAKDDPFKGVSQYIADKELFKVSWNMLSNLKKEMSVKLDQRHRMTEANSLDSAQLLTSRLITQS